MSVFNACLNQLTWQHSGQKSVVRSCMKLYNSSQAKEDASVLDTDYVL